jgi:hypothetical protein
VVSFTLLSFLPHRKSHRYMLVGYESGRPLEQIWSRWRTEQYIPNWESNPDSPVVHPVIYPLYGLNCARSWLNYVVNNLYILKYFKGSRRFGFLFNLLETASQSQSYVTTDGQSASLYLNKAPNWDLRPDLYYCLTITDFLMWGALSDERTGLSFARVTVRSSKSVVIMCNLHFTCY